MRRVVTTHELALGIFQVDESQGLLHVGEFISKERSCGFEEGEEFFRRYLNGEGESVFFNHSFIYGVEDPRGKEKARKEFYVLSLNLLPRKLLHLREDLFL
jgi:hypothetical protein